MFVPPLFNLWKCQAKPGGILLRLDMHGFPDIIYIDETEILYLIVIEIYRAIILSGKYMVKLMFGKSIVKAYLVNEVKYFFKLYFKNPTLL